VRLGPIGAVKSNNMSRFLNQKYLNLKKRLADLSEDFFSHNVLRNKTML
jgi:hypothetical protein